MLSPCRSWPAPLKKRRVISEAINPTQAAPHAAPSALPMTTPLLPSVPNEADDPADNAPTGDEVDGRGIRRERAAHKGVPPKRLAGAPHRLGTNKVVHQSTDLTNSDQQDQLCAALRSLRVEFVHVGTPCASFSRARKFDGGPPPLRTSRHVLGRPNLSPADRRKLEQGNVLADFTARVASQVRHDRGYFSIENPRKSLLWLHPAMKALRKLPGVIMVPFDMCTYGAPWQKPTALLTNFPHLRALRSLCPRTREHLHRPLKGRVWDKRLRLSLIHI